MEIIAFDPQRHYLGLLCRHGHDWNETGKSLRSLNRRGCVYCHRADSQKRYHNLDSEGKKVHHRRAAEFRKNNPERAKAIQLKYRENHRQLSAEKNRRYHLENLERERLRHLQWHTENRQKSAEASRRWQSRNRERVQLQQSIYRKTDEGRAAIKKGRQKRRALKVQVLSVPYDLSKVMQAFDGNCSYCGQQAEAVDHFLPLSKGGTDVKSNVLPCCRRCNSSKWNHEPYEWYRQQSFFSDRQWKAILKYLGKSSENYLQIPLL